jgi:hypothetical protein
MSLFKTEAQVIHFAETNFGPLVESTGSPGLLLAALEAIAANGFDDQRGGNVESATGYFYRIGRWIVGVDGQGFKDVTTYEDQSRAEYAFESLNREFIQEWGYDYE